MPRNLNDTTVVTELLMMVKGGVGGAAEGFLLKSMIISTVLSVFISRLLRLQFRCAVTRVQGEEQWGENTALRSSSADRTGAGCVFSQPH